MFSEEAESQRGVEVAAIIVAMYWNFVLCAGEFHFERFFRLKFVNEF